MISRDKLFIDGAWVASTSSETIEVINPTTEKAIATIPDGTPADVDKAVQAAHRAFGPWAATSVEDRTKTLQLLLEGIQSRMDEITDTYVSEVGAMPTKLAKIVQAGLPAGVMQSYVQILSDFKFEETIGNSLVVREPIGVVGCITPWNYPLHQVVAKVAPALAAGCTVVLKPSEVAPLTAFIFAEIIEQAGVPNGVFNLVTGTGPVVGEAIVSHPLVSMVSFTGSTRAGKRVSELAAASVKRVALELGGKSPSVILDDADVAKAVEAGIHNAFMNAGQTCTALTRVLVPADKRDEAVAAAKSVAEQFALGDPTQDGVTLGPLVSEAQQKRVRDYIKAGIDEGATLVTGGPEQPDGLTTGYFVKPTIFADVTNDMKIAREEIFGPVVAIITYTDEEDALRIANDTDYGLAAAVWSSDPDRAKRVARRLEAGQVTINGGQFNPVAPFGGYKQSGIGRELGRYGLEEFLQTKSMQI